VCAVKAIRQHEFGPPSVLLYEDTADPVPGDDQVLIEVEAAGVHLIDTSIRAGRSGGPFPLPALPMTPGREVAGRVVGDGRRVVAHLGQAAGGYASLAVAPVAALHEHSLDPSVAVALIGTGRTAMGILEVAAVVPGDTVVVTAAAGGLGTLLVQAVRAAGATAIGLAGGPSKAARVEADVAIDYSEPGWESQVPGGVTLVLDGVGGALGRAALETLSPGGRIVLFGYASGSPTEISTGDLYRLGITASAAVGPRIMNRPGGMRELETRALESGLRPAITSFPLADAAAAHAALEARETVGKVVLLP
jgi:NADPH2:quinone reductase